MSDKIAIYNLGYEQSYCDTFAFAYDEGYACAMLEQKGCIVNEVGEDVCKCDCTYIDKSDLERRTDKEVYDFAVRVGAEDAYDVAFTEGKEDFITEYEQTAIARLQEKL